MEHHFQVGDIAAGAHTFDVYPRPPPPTQGLPVNTRIHGYYRHPSTLFDVRIVCVCIVCSGCDQYVWIALLFLCVDFCPSFSVCF